jgi:hypothetical protein
VDCFFCLKCCTDFANRRGRSAISRVASHLSVVSCSYLSCGAMQARGLVVSCRHEQEEEKIGRIVGMDEAQTTGSATRPYHYIVSCDAMQA